MKSKKLSFVMQILFTYLAVSKIIYYMGMVTSLEDGGLGDVFWSLFTRILERDLPIILAVIAFFILDRRISLKKSKYSNVLEHIVLYAVGYVVIMAVTLLYILLLGLVFSTGVDVSTWPWLMLDMGVMYVVVMVVINIKHYFKSKGKAVAESEPEETETEKVSEPEDKTD